MAKISGLVFAAAFVSLALVVDVCRGGSGGSIGICYGRNADDLPTPDKVSKLIQKHNIKSVRIYDSNVQVLQAFSNTSINLIIGIPNSDLLPISQFQSNADSYIKTNILPYYPSTKITHITVGAEVTEDHTSTNATALLIPALRNLFTALKKAGLHKKIKLSTTHSLGILSRSYPPSAGAFNPRYASFLKPLLDFLADNNSPFMVDIYPYFAYSSNVTLDYALFQSSNEVVDQNTGLLYTNMLDAQIDAIYFALTALSYKTVKVMVTETGWPSKGTLKEKAATPENAELYNQNLIRRVVNGNGTPAKPSDKLDVYLFSLFNENRKPGMMSERNWGLFYPDETSVYDLDFTGKIGGGDGNFTSSSSSNSTAASGGGGGWCVASSSVSEKQLQSALDWACGPAGGGVDCTAIQPSQPCYQPDNLVSHASYAFNSYYQANGAKDMACSFGGAAVKVTKDPSYDKCIYTSAAAGSSNNNVTTTTTTVNNATASAADSASSSSSSYSTSKNGMMAAWVSSCWLFVLLC